MTLLAGLVPAAAAAVLEVTSCEDTVPGGAPGELRKAITDAPTGSVILLPACIITLGGAAGDNLNAEGDLDIVGKALVVQGTGPGRSVIDGGGHDRVFHVLVGARLGLRGVTVRNGTGLGAGIGVSAGGELELADSEVRDNDASASFGGGISSAGTVRIRRSTIAGNVALFGGGLSLSGQAAIERSTVVANRVVSAFGTGAGLLGDATALWLDQVTLSSNEVVDPASVNASALHLVSGPAVLDHVTIADNRAGSGGAIRVGGGTLILSNTVLARNAGGNCGNPAPLTSGGHNLQDDASCALSPTRDTSGVDAGLAALGDGGGPTPTHGLLPGSPAIDQGDPIACPPIDQRGALRPQPGTLGSSAACDIGAVERRTPTGARSVAPALAPDSTP